jgi:hypothetical protein
VRVTAISTDTLYYHLISNPNILISVTTDKIDTVLVLKVAEPLGVAGTVLGVLGMVPVFGLPLAVMALVYFARTSGTGFAVTFQYFHKDTLIGEFAGPGYIRYESAPGLQLFWGASENKEFIEADLKEGGTYIVRVDVEMVLAVVRIGFSPIRYTDVDLFEKCRDLIRKKPLKTLTEEEILKKTQKLSNMISKTLQKYETTLKNEGGFKLLPADMAFPPRGFAIKW